MDGQRFDAMARAMANGMDRRGLLRGAAGGAAAVLGLRAAGTRAKQAKQAFCHRTGNPAKPYVVITVAKPAWKAHLAHGDHPFVDCCADADCAADEACQDGACGCAGGSGGPLGSPCNGDRECCSGVCNLDSRSCVVCLVEGVSCTFNQQSCCAGLACVGAPGEQTCVPA